MSQKWFNGLNLQQNQLENAVIQNLAADPSSGKAGQIYYNTADKTYKYHNGTQWVSITAEAIKSITAGNGLTSTTSGDAVTLALGTPSTSGATSGTTYGSNGVTAESHTHQVRISSATNSAAGVVQLAADSELGGTGTNHVITSTQMNSALEEIATALVDGAQVVIKTSNGITGGSNNSSHDFSLKGVDASTTAKGVVQLATQAEVNTGTDTSKVVTPSTLGKGKASGVASLDANGKIVLSQIPDAVYGNVLYGGNFIYNTESQSHAVYPSSSLKARLGITGNIIDLSEDATGSQGGSTPTYGYEELEGVYFICQIQGTDVTSFAFAGEEFEIGDWVISTGEDWQKVDNTDAVKSVNGQTGVVNITKVDSATNAGTATTANKVANKLTFLGNGDGGTSENPTGAVVDKRYDGSEAITIMFPENHFSFTQWASGTTASLSLKPTGVTEGTYQGITIDGFGRVTKAVNKDYDNQLEEITEAITSIANGDVAVGKVANSFSFGAFPINISTDNTFDGSTATALRFASPFQVTKSDNTTTVTLPSVVKKYTTTITGDGTTTDFSITPGLGTSDVQVSVYLTGQTIGRVTGNELVMVDTYVDNTTNHAVHLVFATAPTTSQTFKVVVIG